MSKKDLRYCTRYTKIFTTGAGWNAKSTEFINDYVLLALEKDNDFTTPAEPQRLIKDVLLLLSCTDYTIDDARTSDDFIFIKISPSPPGQTKKEVSELLTKTYHTFNLNPVCTREEFETLRQNRRDALGIFDHYPERSTDHGRSTDKP